MDRRGTDYTDRRLSLIAFIGFIKQYKEGMAEEVLYQKGLRYYDLLLEVIEGKVDISKTPSPYNESEILQICWQILDSFLFNSRSDPFLSLGLSRSETGEEQLRQRWKRLIALCHPDRNPGCSDLQEKAKEINSAYSEALTLFRTSPPGMTVPSRSVRASTGQFNRPTFILKLPAVIVASLVLVAVITAFVYFYTAPEYPQLPLQDTTTVSNEITDETSSSVSTKTGESRYEFQKEEKEENRVPLRVKAHKGEDTDKVVFTEEFRITEEYILSAFKEKEIPKEDLRNYRTQRTKPESSPSIKKNTNITEEKQTEDHILKRQRQQRQQPQKVHQEPAHPVEVAHRKELTSQVKSFLEKYKAYYEQGDLKAFLGLFLEDARENGTPIESLVDQYSLIFRKSRNTYTLEDINIDFEEDSTVRVTARYRIKRYVVDTSRVYNYSGWVRWRLQQTEQGLKIIDLVYE